MADTWGGIARAMEEGVSRNEARSAREEMYPGHLEAARDANAHGIIGLLSGRHRAFVEDNKTRMRELGITPSHRNLSNELTGRYSSGDWKALQDALAGDQAVTTGLGPQDRVRGVNLMDPEQGPQVGSSSSAHAGQPRELDNIRQWGTQNPNMPGSMALDPTWAGGVRGAGLGAEMTPGDRLGEDRDLSGLSRDSRFAPGTVPGNITGTRGYLPGRMSVGEARRARAMRNMSQRDRQEAGFGEGPYSEFDRISRSHDTRHDEAMNRHRQGQVRTRRAHRLAQLALGNTSGTPGMGGHPSQGAGGPNWAALEEDMAMREIRERQFEGRDSR